MKVAVLSALVILVGCEKRGFNSDSNSNNNTADRLSGIATTLAGCYEAKIETGASGKTLNKTSSICIENTPNGKGGGITFKFATADGVLLATLSGNLAASQPRCPGCYNFDGAEALIAYSTGASNSLSLSVVEKSAGKGLYSWRLGAKQEPKSDTGADSQCYKAKVTEYPKNPRLFISGTESVCITKEPNTSSANVKFEFLSADQKFVYQVLEVKRAQSQPRCPGCFNYENTDARIEYRESIAGETKLYVIERTAPESVWSLILTK